MADGRPITVSPLFAPFWAWSNAVVNQVWPTATVMWQRQTGERPAKPYVSIWQRNLKEVGRVDSGTLTDDGRIILINQVQVTLQLDFFGDEAFAAASQASIVCKRPSLRKLVEPWSFASLGAITDISALLDRTFAEQRARLDIVFNGGLRDYDDMGYIEKVCGCGGSLSAANGVLTCSCAKC